MKDARCEPENRKKKKQKNKNDWRLFKKRTAKSANGLA